MSVKSATSSSNAPPVWLYIVITLLAGFIGGLLGGFSSYETLEAPPLAPPGWVFPIVWTILYVLMAIAAWLIRKSGDEDSTSALQLYWVQLAVNILWPFWFFRLSWRLFALVWILLLVALVAWMWWRFRAIRPAAGWLIVPYLAWCLFATYLNFGFYILNP